jgi:hypothetical protein
MDDAAVIVGVARMNLSEISPFRCWEAALNRREPGSERAQSL